jgi:hypothetical protein
MKDEFNFSLADSQATAVVPIAPETFDYEAYSHYEAALAERCRAFWQAEQGVLVYRRMRVREVFAADAADIDRSLRWQLGALNESVKYKADVPNFLEPWYGIGTLAAAFGFGYLWEPGQAPAVDGKFDTLDQLLDYQATPVDQTPIGRHTLRMVETFLDRTKGRLPMSYCDIQSPLNVAANIVDSNQFYLDFFLDPEKMKRALDRIADLLIDFTRRQQALIGSALAKPGHGFASSRAFDGFGMSDDTVVMLSNDIYVDTVVPSFVKAGAPFGGGVFHSCGNWSAKKEDIVRIPGLRMADGAFSLATDPDANPTDGFADAFVATGVVLNARIVGSVDVIEQKVKALWRPGMKLIVVTYCDTPQEQAEAYDRIHAICR